MKYCFIIFLLVSSFVFAEEKVSNFDPDKNLKELNQILKKDKLSKEDYSRIYNLTENFAELSPQTLVKIYPNIEKVLLKNKNYKRISDLGDHINIAYILMGKPEEGLKISQRMLNQYKNELNKFEEIQFKLNEVRYYDVTQQSRKCIALIDKLLQEAEHEHQIAMLESMKAVSNIHLGNYKEGTESYFKALKLYEKHNNKKNIIVTYNQLGLLFFKMGEFDNSAKYYHKAMKLAEKNNLARVVMATYLNLGNHFTNIEQFDSAIYYYDKHWETVKSNENPIDLAKNQLNRAQVYLKLKEFSKAEEALNLSMKICKEQKIPEGLMRNYFSLFDLALMKKDYPKAKSALDSSLYYAQLTDSKNAILETYDKQTNLYKELNDYKKAFEAQKKFFALYEEINGEENKQAIAELEIQYKTELKDKEIEQINKVLQIEKARKNYLIIAISAILGVMVLIIYILNIRNKTLKTLYYRNIEMMNSMQFLSSDASPKTTLEDEPISESSSVNLKKIFDRILQVLDVDKIYTNPNLSLSDTAEFVNSNDKYVSQAIAEFANMNYSNFINFYRINEAKKLIYENYGNLNEVMDACGFNSRTTFYNAFKKHTGMSPKQFKDMAEKKEEMIEFNLDS